MSSTSAPSSDNRKQKYMRAPKSGNLDTSTLEKLSKLNEAPQNDATFAETVSFIKSGLASKVLSTWSFYASSNDHAELIQCTVQISKLTQLVNAGSGSYQHGNTDISALTASQLVFLEAKSAIVDFYKEILSSAYLKVIYRALNNIKPSLTNPTLRILTNILNYSSGALVDEFLNNFDMNLSCLPKLALPSTSASNATGNNKKSTPDHLLVRFNFVRFFFALCSNANPFTRKDILTTHHKILNNIWKHMADTDSVPALNQLLDFVEKFVLEESTFKKATKCKILSENFMYKVQLLFGRLDGNEEFSKRVIGFLTTLATDFKNGLCFVNDTPFKARQEGGVPITVNNKTFRINNKLIYTFLTTLKPWESNAQLLLVMSILEVNTELIGPYTNWIVQTGGGYHDPSLTSWWVGHTLLYNNILQLKIQDFEADSEDIISNKPSYETRLLVETICLAPLSKGSITKCLTGDHPLIRQFAAQLLVLQLNKTNELLKHTSTRKQELVESVISNLPDVATIASCLKEANEKNGLKLWKLTLSMVISKMEQLLSTPSASLSKLINSEIDTFLVSSEDGNTSLSGMDLVKLDQFLSIQAAQNEQEFKWWNKTSNNNNSFFTSLIKLCSSPDINESLIYKNFKLLETLTNRTLVFNKDLIVSPIFAILQLSKSNNEQVWNLLDRTISRAITHPYKYLDLSHQKYNDISLFVIILVEQFKFIFKADSTSNDELVDATRWLMRVFRYLAVIGEPQSALKLLIGEYLKGEHEITKFKEIVENEDLLNRAFNFEASEQLGEVESDSFLNYVISTKLPQDSKRIPITKFDIAGLLLKLNILIENESSSSVIIDLMLKLGNYLISALPEDQDLGKYILSNRFVQSYFVTKAELNANSATTSKLLVSNMVNEIFQQLPKIVFEGSNDFNSLVFELFTGSEITLPLQLFVSKFTWVLKDSQIQQLIGNEVKVLNVYLSVSVCKEAIKRGLTVSSELFSQISGGNFADDLIQILESGKVEFITSATLEETINEVLQDTSKHYLLKSFIIAYNDRNIVQYLVKKSAVLNDQSLLTFIGYCISEESKQFDSVTAEFFARVIPIAMEQFESNKSVWNQTISILTSGLENVNESQIERMIDFATKEETKQGFTSGFANFALEVIKKNPESLENGDSALSVWLHKSMLYITKKFAISTKITTKFDSFILSIETIVQYLPSIGLSVWKAAPISIVNAQLEVILTHNQWVSDSKVLQYVNSVLMTGLRNIVQFERLLQIFLNNEFMPLGSLPSEKTFESRFQSSLVIFNLFSMDIQKNSTMLVLNKLIAMYLGSVRAEDLILKSILIRIEAQLAVSWISQVNNWELSEEMSNEELEVVGGDERLILQDKTGLVVNLHKNFIRNSNNGVIREDSTIVPTSLIDYFGKKNASFTNCWKDIQSFQNTNKLFVNQNYQQTVYDPELLMMLIINNEELVKFGEENKPIVDVKKLVEANLLQFIVNCLALPSVSRFLKVILVGVLKTVSDSEYSYKDKNIYRVYVANILNTLRDAETSSEISTLVWYLHGAIVPILSNPGHFLYERAFRYVLSHPKIQAKHIPMYSSISMSLSSDAELGGDDSHFKQVSWILQQFSQGLSNTKDLTLLRFSGAIEWALNLANSPYTNLRVRSLVYRLLYNMQAIDEGSDLLVARFGVLTSLEQQVYMVEQAGASSAPKAQAELASKQLALNIEELAVRLGITVGSNKRIREWTGDDIEGFVKRVHRKTESIDAASSI